MILQDMQQLRLQMRAHLRNFVQEDGSLVCHFKLTRLRSHCASERALLKPEKLGLQKFSRKGWVCKSYEGELAMSIVPGVAPTIWEFSVRDAAVVSRLKSAIGDRVALHYTEHRGIPTTCFGQTNYFVDSVSIVR